MGISTHVLDTARGRPAAGVGVRLEKVTDDACRVVATAATDDDGRVASLTDPVEAGMYRLVFDVAGYSASTQEPFFPEVVISFVVHDPAEHYHVPLLLSPFAYSTYRGS